MNTGLTFMNDTTRKRVLKGLKADSGGWILFKKREFVGGRFLWRSGGGRAIMAPVPG